MRSNSFQLFSVRFKLPGISLQCPPGTFCLGPDSGFVELPAASSPTLCPPGTFQDESGATQVGPILSYKNVKNLCSLRNIIRAGMFVFV